MKFLRRESERGDFEARPQSKRVMDSFQASPEPPLASGADTGATPNASDSPSITMQTPDNVIGETLVVQGRVEFQNLLRIDGHFEGELVGTGSLIIGPTAEVISNLRGLNEVYVEGILIGDCVCNKMQIRFAGCVTGNLQCASLGMDPSVVLKGSANVNPRDKMDKSKPKSGVPRSRQRSQSRAGSDEASSSSRASTSVPSPESVSLRAPGYEDEKGQSAKQRSRSRGSGELRSDGGTEGRGHGRASSSESIASSATLNGEDLPHLIPGVVPVNGVLAGAGAVPKMGEAVNMPVRSRPPVHAASKPTG